MERILIIKSIYNKFEFHYLYYVVALLSVFTGLFKDFIIFSILIIIHELGHITAAQYFKWEIDKIIVLPFGGLTKFNEHLNKPLFQEFIILIMGPLCQCLFYLLAYSIKPSYMLMNYHYAILIFNMLPIIPLDGSKLVNIICNKFVSFKSSHLITIYLSIVVFTVALLYNITNLIIVLVLFFLFIKIITEYKEHKYIFNKFLFERYLYKIKFKKTKIIKQINLSKMYRDYRHLFKTNNYFRKEEEILAKRFDKQSDL